VDTTTPAGKALFQMMGVFAEFERAMIRERVISGLERAKAQGKALGRKRIDAGKQAAILADLRSGTAGIIKLAGLHGVGSRRYSCVRAARRPEAIGDVRMERGVDCRAGQTPEHAGLGEKKSAITLEI
jgi:DNA invertase Pin-like site-specific DNA recombinase